MEYIRMDGKHKHVIHNDEWDIYLWMEYIMMEYITTIQYIIYTVRYNTQAQVSFHQPCIIRICGITYIHKNPKPYLPSHHHCYFIYPFRNSFRRNIIYSWTVTVVLARPRASFSTKPHPSHYPLLTPLWNYYPTCKPYSSCLNLQLHQHLNGFVGIDLLPLTWRSKRLAEWHHHLLIDVDPESTCFAQSTG